jgi:hypothetical protein
MRRIDPPSFRRNPVAAVLPLCLFLAFGCQKPEDMPVTHPAGGKVAYKDGQPMKGGTIQFTPTAADASFRVMGEMDENGAFTLRTLKGKQTASGAAEGPYRVTVLPPQTADHQLVRPVMLPGTYTVKPGDNVFPTITIPRPPQQPGAQPR